MDRPQGISPPVLIADNEALSVRHDGGVPAEHATDTLVSEALSNRWSENTLRSYRSQFAMFNRWCDEEGMQALPADPITVARYLAHRGNEGISVSTLRLCKASISAAHNDSGLEDPTGHHAVMETMRGLQRQYARPQRQAHGLNADALAAIRSTAMLPRRGRGGSWERPDTARNRGRLEIALCSVLSDAGLRRSEAAELTWADVSEEADGSGRVTILQSKTDLEAEGAVVAITPAAMAALADIRPRDAEPGDLVFRLSPSSIARHIKAAAAAADLGNFFSGHSGRVGCALRMTERGAPMQAVMTQGRWKDARTVARYTRSLTAGEALRWL